MRYDEERDIISNNNNNEDNKSPTDLVNKEKILSEVNRTDNANNVSSNNKEMKNFEVGHQEADRTDEKNLKNSGDGNKENEEEQEIPWFKECNNIIQESKENPQNQVFTSSSDDLDSKPYAEFSSEIIQIIGHLIKTKKKLSKKQRKKGKKKLDKENFELMDFLSSSTPKLILSQTKPHHNFIKYNMNKYKNKELNQLDFESIANIGNNYDHLMNEDKNDQLNELDLGAIVNICTNHDHLMNKNFGGMGNIFNNHGHLMNEDFGGIANIFTNHDNFMNENEEENELDFEPIANICTNHDNLYNNLRNRGFRMINETTILHYSFRVLYNTLTDSTNDKTIKNVYN